MNAIYFVDAFFQYIYLFIYVFLFAANQFPLGMWIKSWRSLLQPWKQQHNVSGFLALLLCGRYLTWQWENSTGVAAPWTCHCLSCTMCSWHWHVLSDLNTNANNYGGQKDVIPTENKIWRLRNDFRTHLWSRLLRQIVYYSRFHSQLTPQQSEGRCSANMLPVGNKRARNHSFPVKGSSTYYSSI